MMPLWFAQLPRHFELSPLDQQIAQPLIFITIGKVFQIESIESALKKQHNFLVQFIHNMFSSPGEDFQSLLEESWFKLEDDILCARGKMKKKKILILTIFYIVPHEPIGLQILLFIKPCSKSTTYRTSFIYLSMLFTI